MGEISLASRGIQDRVAASAAAADSPVLPLDKFDAWFTARRNEQRMVVRQMPLDDLAGWHTLPTGDLAHRSGRFFSLRGLRVRTDEMSSWSQPIIVQPEIGVLGIVMREFDGVLHCLMQAKLEPGNVDGMQLSPTVQATRSNYLRVHGGQAPTYLELMRAGGGRVLADSLQSEQASWFLRKFNRNLVVETTADVPLAENFCWLTLGQISRLLQRPNLVNMDSRTVLAAMPATAPDSDADDFRGALCRSVAGSGSVPRGGGDDPGAVAAWLTEVRFRRELIQEIVPMNTVPQWRRRDGEIRRDDGRFFRIIGVDVQADREVGSWSQPLLAPVGTGLAALLVRRVDGVLQVLLQARVKAGTSQVAELAPTVLANPANYEKPPRFLDAVLAAPPSAVRYDVAQSEEGGRFHHAVTRNLVIEVGEDDVDVPPDYRWVTLREAAALLEHPGYLGVEARTIIACLRSLI
jgi:oxidase EvaA